MIKRAVILLATCFLVLSVSTTSAQQAPPARVVTSPVVLEQISKDQLFLGTIYYERISQISPEISGRITSVKVREGSRVKKGDPLIFLDTELLEKEIQIHENQLELSKLNIDHLEKNFQRMDALYKKGSASEMVYDDARHAFQNALLQEISTRVNLDKLLIQKRKSNILAPFDGVILSKKTDAGDWVNPGGTLLEIGSTDDVYVKVPVAETLMQYLRMGQEVPVHIHAYDKKIKGVIETLSPIADAKTKNIFLKVRIPSMKKMAQNMSASVRIPAGKPETLALIPRDALVKFQGKDYVYTIRDKKAVMLPVNIVRFKGTKVGADNDHFKAGIPVVVDGNERLRPGQEVMVSGEK